MKKIKYLIIILLLIISTKNIYAYTFDNTTKVYDYAQVLTDKEEDNLIEKAKQYIDNNNMDMVIVTVKYYTYEYINEYINEFYNRNKFGIGNNKSGIIVVIDLKNNSIGIETFGNTKDLYNKSEINDIISKMNENDKYYDKLLDFIKYSNEYITKDEKINNNTDSVNYLLVLTFSFIISIIVGMLLILKANSIKPINYENHYIRMDSTIINIREDKYLNTSTKQINK
jgi:uncharacterized protein